MSYCRFGEGSDLYVIETRAGIECIECGLQEFDDAPIVIFTTRAKAFDHLRAHVEAGHQVPQAAIDELEREIREGVKLCS